MQTNTKAQAFAQLAEDTATHLTSSLRGWTGFLVTVGRLYKYPYHEQLMIYAQRPDATACADYELWNNKMNRFVQPGSTGIALLDPTGDTPKLKYVFDVSDTGGRDNSRRPFLWEMREHHEQPILEMLEDKFDIHADNLLDGFYNIAKDLAAEYYDNHKEDLPYLVENSFLEDYDEDNLRVAFENAADILNSLEHIQSFGVNLICIEEGIDSSQTSGKLLISVLSAVAEIERENIIEQTMNGRKEKARQGGWNGGFAPYGYYLKDKQLFIQEDETEAVRIIFDKYVNGNMGFYKIANYLNLQGIQKVKRDNGTLTQWSTHFVRMIIDNPVYYGKIAFGRRTREKVKGTKNEYRQVQQDDYILADGQHDAIISEELWTQAHEKREITGMKSPSKIGRDRAHLLSGILKCPKCGGPMYTNKHAWRNKDGTYKEIYYYVCSKARTARGKSCDYKAMLKKTDIEPLVIEAIRELIKNEDFATEIKSKIGKQIDTSTLDRELKNYEGKLREVDLNKTRLENEIDSLPEDTRFRERKLHDMTLRLDSLYDIIVELEEKIEDVKLRRKAVEQDTITLENIYTLLANFDKCMIKSGMKQKNL